MVGRAPGGGYGGARARASAQGGSFRVQRGRRGGLTRLMRRSGEEGTGNQHLQTVQIGPAHQVMAQQSQLNKAVSHLH